MSGAFFKKLQNISKRIFQISLGTINQCRIMTERASEITAAGEYRTGDKTRVIQQCQFL
jgi:hypothetical protein